MAKTLVTSKGTPIQIGRELGRGGEGSVFEVPALSNQVAKLYHQPPDAKKQAKLIFMANTADQQLLKYVAWPLETLHSSKGGPVVGFLMSKIVGKDPVHMVYSPAHRRQERPRAAWDFLLYVSRNTAAAFEVLHAHGHVLGDVNQGNVLVGNDSKVFLIDSDSYQVNANGNFHLCEVGVSHFTSPELQKLSSFDGVTRTANHDNFGLALLIFHLLFGGRHPYSGVPLKQGIGDALEDDIKGFRYAYARDAANRGISPPPRSIPVSTVPANLETMFHHAFTEKGSAAGRPTAAQWVAALDGLRKTLNKCGASSVHLYPNHLSMCPWCNLEQQGVIYFLDISGIYTTNEHEFNLTQVWAQIETVTAPPLITVPNLSAFPVTPTPFVVNMDASSDTVFLRLAIICIASYFIYDRPKSIIIIFFIAWLAWYKAGAADAAARTAKRVAEITRRKTVELVARNSFNSIVAQAKLGVGIDGFVKKKEEYRKLKEEMLAIPAQESNELAMLRFTAQERQKRKFLEKYFIDTADIPGLGPTRKAALRSFGIETAADVTRNSVSQVRGFGESLTRSVIDWKASLDRRFVFNPTNSVSEADKNSVRTKYALRKTAIAAVLRGGVAELQKIKQATVMHVNTYQPQIDNAAKQLGQAQKDLTIL